MFRANNRTTVTPHFPRVKIFPQTIASGSKKSIILCNEIGQDGEEKRYDQGCCERDRRARRNGLAGVVAQRARPAVGGGRGKDPRNGQCRGVPAESHFRRTRTPSDHDRGRHDPDISNTLFPPIVRGTEAALEPAGYALILVNTDDVPDRKARLFDVLLQRGVDGIIDVAVTHMDPHLDARLPESSQCHGEPNGGGFRNALGHQR